MTNEEKKAAMKALQTRSNPSAGSLETNEVFIHLKKHGSIVSTDPLLAKLNPQSPKDAVYSMRTRFAVQLFDLGLYVASEGRKPTKYSLKPIPSTSVNVVVPEAKKSQKEATRA